MVWDCPAPASVQQWYEPHLGLGKSPNPHLSPAQQHQPHSWAGAEPSSSSPRQTWLCALITSSVLKEMSAPNFNLLYTVHIVVVIHPVFQYISGRNPYLMCIYIYIYVTSGGSRTAPYREVSEHQVLWCLGLLVSLDSFYVCHDLWVGTSETIKVIWRHCF